MSSEAAAAAAAAAQYPPIKLPHPFLTSYRVAPAPGTTPRQQLVLTLESQPANGRAPPQPFHAETLTWQPLAPLPEANRPPLSENTQWARARRAPHTTFHWPTTTTADADADDPPSPAALWNVVHAIFLGHPTLEYFRLTLAGQGSSSSSSSSTAADTVRDELLAAGLAIPHPLPQFAQKSAAAGVAHPPGEGELLVLRAAFWQGAYSPTGPRPIWVVGSDGDGDESGEAGGEGGEGRRRRSRKSRIDRAQQPPMPELYTLTNRFPAEPVYTRHPVRQPKPAPGAVVYSRWVPEARQHFSLEVVDWARAEHVALFHAWQNDPRVAAGWNETGTLAAHRAYLRRLHLDPHVLCLYGRFDETRFAYFELYWAKEDHYGAHYEAHDYDRGRHSLVGDASFRGAQRVNAWYSSCIHYCFLDDVRTVNVVGEPKAAGATILSYENAQGLTIGKYVDFAHKRSVHSVASREKWFQLCPLFWDGREKPLESADRAAWNAKL